MITDWAPDGVVTEVRAAHAAARAARAVPGVRLQPGVWGLLGQFAAQAWEQATGQDLPDLAGVEATRTGEARVRVELRLVLDGGYQAAAVGAAVQQAAAAAVTAHLDGMLADVHVRIVEIDLDLDRA